MPGEASDAESEPGTGSEDDESESDSSISDAPDGGETCPVSRCCAETDDTRLDKLVAEIEVVTINTHVDVIKDTIRREKLPVSPGTRGKGGTARTNFIMINEVRSAVGISPLPVEALLHRRSKPDAKPEAPMGIPVEPPSPVVTAPTP